MECSNPQCPFAEEVTTPSALPAAPVRCALEAPKPVQSSALPTSTVVHPMGVGLSMLETVPPRPVFRPRVGLGVEALPLVPPVLEPGAVNVVIPQQGRPPSRIASFFGEARRGRKEARPLLPVRENSGFGEGADVLGDYEVSMFDRLIRGLHAMKVGESNLPVRVPGRAKRVNDRLYGDPQDVQIIRHHPVNGSQRMLVAAWADTGGGTTPEKVVCTTFGTKLLTKRPHVLSDVTTSLARQIDDVMEQGPNGFGLPDFSVPDFSCRATTPVTPVQHEAGDVADETARQVEGSVATAIAFIEGARSGRSHSEDVPMSAAAAAVPAVEVFRPGIGLVPLEEASFPAPVKSVSAVTPVVPIAPTTPSAPISVMPFHLSPLAGWKPLTDDEKRELEEEGDYAPPVTSCGFSAQQSDEGDDEDFLDNTGDAWRRK